MSYFPFATPFVVVSNPTVYNQSDTYTTFPSTGNIVNATNTTVKYLSINVTGSGASATSWTVLLEGSHDGVLFTPILTHDTSTLNGIILYSGATASPCIYFRSHCTALVLGSATNVVVTIVATS